MSHFNNVNVGVTGFVFDSRYTFTGLGYLAVCWQKQWGASGYAVTFPIAFNVVYNVLSIPQTTASTSNAYWGRFYITALTKNGFNVSDTGAGSNRWIAIGSAQPQWGYCSSRTATFPIPFPTAALFIVAVPKTTSTSATATGAEYLGTTSVNLYLHGTSGWYFVGGH